MLKIIQAPNEVLSTKTQQVRGSSPWVDSKLLKQMEEALDKAQDPKGVGLAAPQVGVPLSFFVTKPSKRSKLAVFINPRILSVGNKPKKRSIAKSRAKSREKKLEGCLSLKDIWGEVKRYGSVTLEYSDEKGMRHTKKFDGVLSTIVQHEIDHLEGILFPKRVLEQKGKLYKSSKNEKNELVFDPIEL